MAEADVRAPLLGVEEHQSLQHARSGCVLHDECFLSVGKAKSNEQSSRVRRKLWIATCLAFLFMIAEVVGGYMAKSVAIMSDAAHMLSDVSAFLVAIFAAWAATQRSTQQYSFGYHRVEILGALISVLIIWMLSGALVVEAVQRVLNPVRVDGKLMFIVASAGIVFNIVMALALGVHAHHGHSHGDCGHSQSHSKTDSHKHGSCSHSHSHSQPHAPSHGTAGSGKCQHSHSPGHSHGHSHSGPCQGHGHSHSTQQPPKDDHVHTGGGQCHHHHHDSSGGSSSADSSHGHSSDHSHEQGGCDHDHAHEHNHDDAHDHGHDHQHGSSSSSHQGQQLPPPPAGEEVAITVAAAPADSAGAAARTSIDIAVRCAVPALPLSQRASDHHGDHDHEDHDHHHDHDNINLRGAVLHVIGDLVQSMGVALAGALIWYNQDDPRWYIADPICTFVFSVLVLLTTSQVLRDIIQVLMERTPRSMDVAELMQAMMEVEGIEDVHDLHVWNISTGIPVLMAHVHVGAGTDAAAVLQQLEASFQRRGIKHSTVQICNPPGVLEV